MEVDVIENVQEIETEIFIVSEDVDVTDDQTNETLSPSVMLNLKKTKNYKQPSVKSILKRPVSDSARGEDNSMMMPNVSIAFKYCKLINILNFKIDFFSSLQDNLNLQRP